MWTALDISSKWSNFPTVLPKPHSQETVQFQGREQHLIPPSNDRVPREDQEGTAQLLPMLLSCHGKNSCLNASLVNASVSCLCLAASHQAVSMQLGRCIYKVWAVTNSATSKQNFTSPSTALPSGTVTIPTINPAANPCNKPPQKAINPQAEHSKHSS